MIEQYAQSLGHFLQANPSWGGIFTFVVAFLESLALVGTIIPGSVTMTAVGMLIGSAILPFWITLLWATLGAFIGDLLGYWLGNYYNERLRNMWPFKKHPQWLEAGENFFHKHGGKSILIGRFIGPLRSIIPLIAGLLHMPLRKFILAALPTAALWAIAYMLPGILLGALSLQLPPNVATKFILLLLLVIVVLSLFAWILSFFSSKIKQIINHTLKRSWQYLKSNQRFFGFTKLIANKDNSNDYHQLGWVFLFVITSVLFFIIVLGVFAHNDIIIYNRPIFEFLRSIRNANMDRIMIGITLLGEARVLLISACFILGWLFVHKNKRAAFHWVVAIAIAMIVPNLFKLLLYFPRPTGLLHASSTSSFPSGHTFLGMMFYGFLAALMTSHIKMRYRRYSYYFAGAIILLIAFSRIYLGSHWLTDVIGSILLGSALLALITLSYRKKILPLNVLNFFLFSLCITLFIWLFFFVLTYQKNLLHYSLKWPSQVIDVNVWWGRVTPALPMYRQNRIGKPTEPMNIQFSGNIQQLANVLAEEGWTANPNMTLLSNTIKRLSETQTSITPYLPSLYLNKAPVLFRVKNMGNVKLILKIWRSNIYLSETWDVLYIGNIAEYKLNHKKKKITYTYNAISKLIPFLSTNDWRIKIISTKALPKELLKQKWNGEILQISAPTLY